MLRLSARIHPSSSPLISMSNQNVASRGLSNHRGRGRTSGRGGGRGRDSGPSNFESDHLSGHSNGGAEVSPGILRTPRLAPRAPKPRLTHFLALPLGHHAGLRHTISTFTDGLLEASPSIPGLDRSIIIPARRLHLTLGVMSLNTDAIPSASKSTAQAFPVAPHGSDPGTAQSRPRTLSSAISLLQEIRPRIMEILGQERLRVSLRCMDIMKPERQDLERAHVMWVGPSHDGEDAKQLKKVSEFVNRTFKSAGFVVDEGRSLKLHCTVLNTTYRKPRSKGRQPFSYASILASEALRTVNTMSTSSTETVNLQTRRPMAVDFGEWDIDEVQICEMGSWGPEGEYVCVGRCPLI